MLSIPKELRSLIERPLLAHLATVRPDGSVQVNPMSFVFDGESVRFSHNRHGQKLKNLEANPTMAFSVVDPADHFRYAEVRGRLVEVIDDPTGSFNVEVQRHYGEATPSPPPDAADRVVLRMAVERVTGRA